jgi:hypothetical protein
MLMKTSVILWERTGIWATAMSRQLSDDVPLVQVRGHDECLRELAAAPASVVALELTVANLAQMADLCGEIVARYPYAAAVVLGTPELANCDPLVREAGALHYFASPRELAGWRQTVLNHIERIPTGAGDIAESVWHSLPWSDAATA